MNFYDGNYPCNPAEPFGSRNLSLRTPQLRGTDSARLPVRLRVMLEGEDGGRSRGVEDPVRRVAGDFHFPLRSDLLWPRTASKAEGSEAFDRLYDAAKR